MCVLPKIFHLTSFSDVLPDPPDGAPVIESITGKTVTLSWKKPKRLDPSIGTLSTSSTLIWICATHLFCCHFFMNVGNTYCPSLLDLEWSILQFVVFNIHIKGQFICQLFLYSWDPYVYCYDFLCYKFIVVLF